MKKNFNIVFKIITGNAFAQLIVIFTTPLLTRIYEPDDFGSLAILNGIILIFGVVGCARYDQLVFKYKSKLEWNKCYSNAVFYSCIGVAVSSLLLITFRDVISYTFSLSLPILLLTFSLSQIYSSVLSISGQYVKITRSFIIKVLSVFLSQYILFKYIGGEGLVAGLVIGQITQTLFLFYYVRKEKCFYFNANYIGRMSKDSLMSSFQSLLNSFSSQLPSLFIPFKYGLELMGYYSMALRLTYIPITFFSNALRPFVLGEINNNIEDKNKLYKAICFFSIGLLGLAALGILLINLFAVDFFKFYAGSEWEVSGEISGVLSFWVLLAFSNILSTSYLTVFSKFKQLLIYDAFLLLFRCGVVLISGVIGLGFFDFIKLYSAVGFLFNLSIIIYTLWLVRNEKNIYSYHS